MAAPLVREVLNQTLQTLQFLHTQKLRLPSGQIRQGITHGQEFYLSGEDGYIGRRGQNSTTTPAIDLTGIAHEGIVSRSHARVY
jgi:hypothetical protein